MSWQQWRRCLIIIIIITIITFDDTVLIFAHKNLKMAESTLQHDFTQLIMWTHDNNLVINADKTKILHICSPLNHDRQKSLKIVFHSYECLHAMVIGKICMNCDVIIECVDNHVYLGVVIDRFLSWRPHITTLCKRLRSCAF